MVLFPSFWTLRCQGNHKQVLSRRVHVSKAKPIDREITVSNIWKLVIPFQFEKLSYHIFLRNPLPFAWIPMTSSSTSTTKIIFPNMLKLYFNRLLFTYWSVFIKTLCLQNVGKMRNHARQIQNFMTS